MPPRPKLPQSPGACRRPPGARPAPVRAGTLPRSMDLGIGGRVALVTGASSGLGLGIARALADEGARVAVTSRSRERIDAAAQQVGGTGFVHDNTAIDGVPQLVKAVESELGPIDILVTNSGGAPPAPPP